jgi:hypothetical protein
MEQMKNQLLNDFQIKKNKLFEKNKRNEMDIIKQKNKMKELNNEINKK